MEVVLNLTAGEVRLDPGATKNGEGRVFPFTTALRRVLEAQQAIAETLRRERGLLPRTCSATRRDTRPAATP